MPAQQGGHVALDAWINLFGLQRIFFSSVKGKVQSLAQKGGKMAELSSLQSKPAEPTDSVTQ